MTTIKAIVRSGRLETAEPVNLPDGTELTIALPGPSAPASARADLGADTPEAIAAWLRWYDALEPREVTPEEQAAWDTARQQDRAAELARWDEQAKTLEQVFP